MKKVVVFFGLIASGKSFVAKAWAKRHGFPYYNTDVVRKQLAGKKPTETCVAEVGGGIYSPAFTRLTYEALAAAAGRALEDPALACVVLDGSYQTQAERQRLLSRLAGQGKVIFVMCSCQEETIKARLRKRAADPAAVSDGRWEIYLRQKENFEYPEELAFGQFRRLNTESELHRLLPMLDRQLLGSVARDDEN